MPFFASKSVQTTTGGRGTTTRRKRTRTVRGNEGAYCAMIKEELLARPPREAFRVTTTITYDSGIVNVCECHRPTLDEAEQYVTHMSRDDGRSTGVRYDYRIDPVQVRWVWDNGRCVERVVG